MHGSRAAAADSARSAASQGYSSRTKSTTSGGASAGRGFCTIGGPHGGTAGVCGAALHGALSTSTITWKREQSLIGKAHGQIVTFRYNDVPKTPEAVCKERIADALEIDDYEDLKEALGECRDPADTSAYLVTTSEVARLLTAIRRHVLGQIRELRAKCKEAEKDGGDVGPLQAKILKKIEELKVHGASSTQVAEVSGVKRKPPPC